MAKIDIKYLIPKDISTVFWSWTDDEGQLHTNKLNIVIYFPYLPVNILSSTGMAEFMNYDHVTSVIIKGKYSIFTWYFGK